MKTTEEWIKDMWDSSCLPEEFPIPHYFTKSDLENIVEDLPADLYTMAHNRLEEKEIEEIKFDWKTWAIEQLNSCPCIYDRHSGNHVFMQNMPFDMEERFWTALLLHLLK